MVVLAYFTSSLQRPHYPRESIYSSTQLIHEGGRSPPSPEVNGCDNISWLSLSTEKGSHNWQLIEVTRMLQVVGGEAVIPDYFHPDTAVWLQDTLSNYRCSLCRRLSIFLTIDLKSLFSFFLSTCLETNLKSLFWFLQISHFSNLQPNSSPAITYMICHVCQKFHLFQLTTYRSTISFDGVFIDENEPSTVSDGAVGGCSQTDPYDDPVYSLS